MDPTLFYTYRGRTLTRQQISSEFGIPYSTLWNRLAAGWSIERAIETPVAKQVRRGPSEAERQVFAHALDVAPQIFSSAERRAVSAVMVEGLSVYQAASQIGVRYGHTVSHRLDTARRVLRIWLEGKVAT